MTKCSDLRRAIQKQWIAEGLCNNTGAVVPTFIEEIGAASAENVRSAALKRWMNAHPEHNTRWLTGLIPELASRAPFTARRELTLDSNNRIDLVLHDKDGRPAVFIENKWLSPMEHPQIDTYRKIIDREYPGSHLIAIGPIAHARPQHDPEVKFVATTWQDLAAFVSASMQGSGSGETPTIEGDLSKTLQRIRTMSDAISEAVERGSKLSEFFDLFGWLSADGQARDTTLAYDELVRRLVITRLADKLERKLNSGDGTSRPVWRRSLATSGARRDFQADVCPTTEGDGLVAIPGAPDNAIALFVRFHSYKEFSGISLQVGTALLPYLEGQKRKEWESRDHARQSSVRHRLREVRTDLAKRLRADGYRKVGSADTAEWYKGFGKASFGADSSVADLLEYAASLARPINGTLRSFA
ncbi:MAG: hypothetical protein Kow0026_16520 [Oricola sp.]